MKRTLILLLFCLWGAFPLQGQSSSHQGSTPVFALKSNLLHDATTSLNLGLEFKVGRRLTLDLPVTYNPWSFSDNKKFKHILVQPELRFWLCEPFNGHFFGLHGHYAFYNVGGLGTTHLQANRYEGWLAGAGISYGYQFYLSSRLNLELSVGAGYAYMDYDRYDSEQCGDLNSRTTKHYFGPTRASVTLIFLIK